MHFRILLHFGLLISIGSKTRGSNSVVELVVMPYIRFKNLFSLLVGGCSEARYGTKKTEFSNVVKALLSDNGSNGVETLVCGSEF